MSSRKGTFTRAPRSEPPREPLQWLFAAADQLVELRAEVMLRRDAETALARLCEREAYSKVTAEVSAMMIKLWPQKYGMDKKPEQVADKPELKMVTEPKKGAQIFDFQPKDSKEE